MIFGALCFVVWAVALLALVGWRGVGLGLRSLGWQVMSQRSEHARMRFMELFSRVAPLPRMSRISPYEGGPGA
ncbi:MAG: hypothetical protein FJZ38_13205 [Candidatus Rokubacteria bacterium]|nr:hypothetical protein [Candidatus Rokubacteria bacterium]